MIVSNAKTLDQILVVVHPRSSGTTNECVRLLFSYRE